MDDRNGCSPSFPVSDISPAHGTDEILAIISELEKLSTEEQMSIRQIIQNVSKGEASLAKDKQGNVIVEYKKHSFVNRFKPGKIVVPKSYEDLNDQVEAFLSFVDHIKTNNMPYGVACDTTEAPPSRTGHYREGKEYIELDKILGKGLYGNIIGVKNLTTGKAHAQKTIMISDFRPEELLAWIKLDIYGGGLCPRLYIIFMKYDTIVFHMEILTNAVTLEDIIDKHMPNIRKKKPELVRRFCLYMLQCLLSAIDVMRSKNWSHLDLHGGNVMVQYKDQGLKIKVLDFGKAKPYEPDYLKNDIYQVVRLFTGLYIGQTFYDKYYFIRNYEEYLTHTSRCLTEEDKAFQLVEAVMTVAKTGENMEDTISDIVDKMGTTDEIDLMNEKIGAILFDENGVESDGTRDYKTSCVPDDLIRRSAQASD